MVGGSGGLLVLAIFLYLFTDLFFDPPQGVASQPRAGEWAMFGRNLAHTGATEAAGAPATRHPQVDVRHRRAIHSSPAVVDGIVYFGSQDNGLYALDAATGSVVWQFRAASQVQSSPAVVDGVVYFGANDGWFRALDAGTGAELWSYRTRYPITASPAVANGRVYVGTTDRELLALDAATGKLRWSSTLGGEVYSSPAVANGLVYVGTLSEFFYIVHAGDGRIRTWFRTRRDVSSSAAVDGITVYFTTTAGRLYAIDGTRRGLPLEHRFRRLFLRMKLVGMPAPRIGEQTGHLWELDVGTSSTSSPLVAGGALYVGADDNLVAVDRGTREVLWRFRTPGPGKLLAAAGRRSGAGRQRGRERIRGARRHG